MAAITALRINGKATAANPGNGALAISNTDALNAILAAEGWPGGGTGYRDPAFSDQIWDELPAIASHWLQSPMDAPVLLDESFSKKWIALLRSQCLLRQQNPASGPGRELKHPRPVHIDFSGLPFPPVSKPKFTFMDLFAGIGGFRIALQNSGGKCVFSSEWDRHAKETYFKNYGEVPFGDITQFSKTNNLLETIPDHTILCGGFPCQPFSQAGLKLGFDDARGTLFFDILSVAKAKKPEVLFLENVKRLQTHDHGRTFKVIMNSLREIGYHPHAKVLRAYDFGVPQNRERIFIVAFREPLHFEFPTQSKTRIYKNFGEALEPKPDARYTITDRMWEGHQKRRAAHAEKGNGFGYSLFDENSEYVNTISARYWKDGSEILIKQKGGNPRTLTPRESVRIQGYPEEFIPHQSRKCAYKQSGNSVAVPVIYATAQAIISALHGNLPQTTLLPLT